MNKFRLAMHSVSLECRKRYKVQHEAHTARETTGHQDFAQPLQVHNPASRIASHFSSGGFVGLSPDEKPQAPRCREKRIVRWQGILPLRTHTPLKEGRETLFRGGGRSARKTDEDPNRKQTEQAPKRNRKPHAGSPRGKPQPRNTKHSEPEFSAEGKNPKQPRNPPKPGRRPPPQS